jgi:predicted AlkP superfamily phosphohydrolase/phosphomutase
VKGFVRFYLDSLEPHIKLYATPVNLHPDNPLPLSYPHELAQRVWKEEPYKTLGWAIDTWSIGSDLMDEEQFLADMYLTVDRFEKFMLEFLDNPDRDLYIQVFSYTDRICHVLWRYMDDKHPRYEADKAEKYRKAIYDSYRRMDSIVGKAMELIDFKTTELIVCSDHGFASFRYQVNFNTWLVKNGFMKLNKNVLGIPMELDDLTQGRSPFTSVDWKHTKAYALGLGMMFINLEGREPEGSVKPEEYEAVRAEIAEKLMQLVDEKTGMKPIRQVYTRDQMYTSYNSEITPDLRIATTPPYRVSWDTTLGGMPVEITELNNRTWSGDHCSLDPHDVKGILFSSIPIKKDQPEMLDVCPSMLSVLGIAKPKNMEGKVLF